MWKCPKCGEGVEDHLDLCANCGGSFDPQGNTAQVPASFSSLSRSFYGGWPNLTASMRQEPKRRFLFWLDRLQSSFLSDSPGWFAT